MTRRYGHKAAPYRLQNSLLKRQIIGKSIFARVYRNVHGVLIYVPARWSEFWAEVAVHVVASTCLHLASY